MIFFCICEVPPAIFAPGAERRLSEPDPDNSASITAISARKLAISNINSVIPNLIKEDETEAADPCR